MPVSFTSLTYIAFPVTLARPSRRGTEWLTTRKSFFFSPLMGCLVPASLMLAFFYSRRLLDRAHDRDIAGAAADVAVHVMDDLLARRLGVLVQQRLGGEDHPGRAEAALEGELVDEGLLHRMERAVGLGQAFDRDHALAARLVGEQRARAHRQPVDQHGAGAADLDLAGDLRPREVQPLAQDLGQRFLVLVVGFDGASD